MFFKVIFNLENIAAKHFDLKSKYSDFSVIEEMVCKIHFE